MSENDKLKILPFYYTWAEFKQEVERQGITDDTPIGTIDVWLRRGDIISVNLPRGIVEYADIF